MANLNLRTEVDLDDQTATYEGQVTITDPTQEEEIVFVWIPASQPGGPVMRPKNPPRS